MFEFFDRNGWHFRAQLIAGIMEGGNVVKAEKAQVQFFNFI
tara:strand:- start:163 stop:285 length:123 start_codon:yes stop_codon:yes gene_type:complete